MRKIVLIATALSLLPLAGCDPGVPPEELGEVTFETEELPGQDYEYPIPGSSSGAGPAMPGPTESGPAVAGPGG